MPLSGISARVTNTSNFELHFMILTGLVTKSLFRETDRNIDGTKGDTLL